MPSELEAKMKLDSHDELRERLCTCGATFIGRVLERNHIFDDAAGTLLSNDCGLRVRRCEPEEGDAPPPTLTYKGPREPGPVKHREEIEVELGDGDRGRLILLRLGYIEKVSFQKRRESWVLDTCHIELDELPFLGNYVEVEGPDEQTVQAVIEQLDLHDRALIRESYIALLVDYCHSNGLATTEIIFG